MDRHVIANMGAELGATSTVFPSDEAVREFLREQDRVEDWIELVADPDAEYDRHDEIDLSTLEPLIAKPSSPDAVVPVRELAGMPIYQSYIGSSANPGYRDFAIVAQIVKDRQVADQCFVRYQPDLPPVAGGIDRGRRNESPDPCRCPPASGGLQWMYRHGAGACQRQGQPADGAAQLPGSFRDERRSGLFVQPGNRGCFRLDRCDHRPASIGNSLSESEISKEAYSEQGDVGPAAAGRSRRFGSSW